MVCGAATTKGLDSPIIGEIAVGIAFKEAKLVPYLTPDAEDEFDAWTLLGQLGVSLIIFESGLHINLKKVQEVGKSAFIVGTLGTFMPVLFAVFTIPYILWSDYPVYPDGVSAGFALAPTSVGIALKLLMEVKQLNSKAGQTIITSAFLDDIYSIILIVVLNNLADGSFKASKAVLLCLECFAFVGVAAYASNKLVPRAVSTVLMKISEHDKASVQPADEMHLLIMAGGLVAFAYVGYLIGSHLLGVFVAGILFCRVPRSMMVWKRQVKRIVHWLMRFFFGATVAFSIPLETLLDGKLFAQGVVIAIIPTVVAKLTSGLALGKNRWVVGWAMVGRGEFAYLVADTAQQLTNESGERMMSRDVYVAVMWALLIATVVAPVTFRHVLLQSFKNEFKSGIRKFTVRMQGHHHTGVLHEVCDVLHSLGLDVCSAHVETDGDVDIETFLVRIRGDDPNDDLSKDKMDEIRHELLEAMNSEAQVILAPVHDEEDSDDESGGADGGAGEPRKAAAVSVDEVSAKTSDSEGESDASSIASGGGVVDGSSIKDYWLEIKILGDHHADTLDEILHILDDFDLDIVNARIAELGQKDVEIFHVKDSTNSTSLPEHRRIIRERVCTVFKAHGIKGEVMIKVVSSEQAHTVAEDICLPSPRHGRSRSRSHSSWRLSQSFSMDQPLLAEDDLIEISIFSIHDKTIFSEIVTTLHKMHLDVHKAEIVTNADNEESFEFIVDDNQELASAISLLSNMSANDDLAAQSKQKKTKKKKRQRPRSLPKRSKTARSVLRRLESFNKSARVRRKSTTSAGIEINARIARLNSRERLEKAVVKERRVPRLPSFQFNRKEFQRARRRAIKSALCALFEEKQRKTPDIPFNDAKIIVRPVGASDLGLRQSPEVKPAPALELPSMRHLELDVDADLDNVPIAGATRRRAASAAPRLR